MISEFHSKIKKNKKIILYGAGVVGEICLFGFNQHKIKVDFFCDSDTNRTGDTFNGLKILSPTELKKLDKDRTFYYYYYYVFLKNDLNALGFKNILNCELLLNSTDFSNSNLSISALKVERWVSFYNAMIKREIFKKEGKVYVKSLDVQITEHCSLRCKDCSNLMQYYSKTKNSNIDILFNSIDRFMSCVDQLYEFRVIGGDPFMNKDMHKIINFLSIL